ncbi:MAG TPA: SGNH/GDSL hydrolase family protein [Actinomycetota bacterium]|nr:SGNH/GDSL hydrolase family protein [Actinomycetota bacterium]
MSRLPLRGSRWAVTLGTALLMVSAVAGAAAAAPGPGEGTMHYYLALGDSLAAGAQPNQDGLTVPTKTGYANDVLQAERTVIPGIQLRNMGCLGETTTSMIAGGVCSYGQGSQLGQAVHFLQRNAGSVSFVTIDIGANDVDGCIKDGSVGLPCVQQAFANVQKNLPAIMSQLRAAAPGVPIVGMNYYDPFLAAWLQGPAGQTLAQQSEQLAEQYNGAIDAVYGAFGAPVADVQTTFSTSDFTDQVNLPGFGPVPRNVARVCEWTWMCVAPPRGPNIHANGKGYLEMAAAFEAVLSP